MLDGLSYPLSLAFALQRLRLRPPQPGPLYVLIIGASSKAEERLVRESDYWQELARFIPEAKAIELNDLLKPRRRPVSTGALVMSLTLTSPSCAARDSAL